MSLWKKNQCWAAAKTEAVKYMAELGDRFGGADVDGTMNERIETGHLN